MSSCRFSKAAFQAGIEQTEIDGITLQYYDAEKPLADCFKFRNKLGMDVVLEALQLYRTRKPLQLSKLLAYARLCRVLTTVHQPRDDIGRTAMRLLLDMLNKRNASFDQTLKTHLIVRDSTARAPKV